MRYVNCRRLFLVALVVALLAPARGVTYMAILRQGVETTEVPNADDAHGDAVAAGDFNRDGFMDLAMAAPDESNGLVNGFVHGGVVISYGSAAGLTHIGADWITVGDVGTDTVRFGRSLVAADFNNDGFDDLAVGLPYVNLSLPLGVTDAGQVWVYYGSASGLQLAAGTVLDQSMVAGAAAENGDLFGWSLTAGRFNSDVYPDLAVGSIGEDNEAGAAFYFYSGATGVKTAGAAWVKLTDLGDVAEANAWLGYAVEANDFDGNGTDDLAIGAPKKSSASLLTGRVYVVYSTPTGLNPSFVTVYDPLILGLVAEAGSRFGWSLTSGNYWTDKISHDLAIGEPFFNQSGQADAGRAIVLRLDPPPTKPGDAAGVHIQTPAAINILRQGVNGNETAEPSDEFGYALASGNYMGDALDEIAVGAPFEDITQGGLGTMFFSGALTVYEGWPLGPMAFQDHSRVLNVDTQNDHTIGGENFGKALCFGRFDNSGYAALAIGAPGRNYESYLDGGSSISDAGAVYISAPWRQPRQRPHRSSVVWDCDQNIVYAQRPFDPVNPASTTKSLTLLLACQFIEANPAMEFYDYTVEWAHMPNIGGSLVPLYFHEQMEFHNLMKTMMTVSGNDAGYALGDIMTGETATWSGYTTTLTDFADLMNTKKAQLGLSTSTHMTNPSGMDYGFDPDHVTNAMDWVELAHDVMQNSCVREIVGEPCWDMERNVPQLVGGWLGIPANALQTQFCNGFVSGLQSGGFPAMGVKGGSTPSAMRTGLGSATALGGEVFAAWFGVRKKDDPPGHPGGDNGATGRELLQVGRAACELDVYAPPPAGPPDPYVTLQGLSSQSGTGKAMCAGLLDGHDEVANPENLEMTVAAQVLATPSANVHLAIQRNSEAELGPSEQLSFNYSDVAGFHGATILNTGTSTVALSVTASHPSSGTWTFNLAPNTAGTIPATSVGGQNYTLTIHNNTRSAANLSIDQMGLTFAAQVGSGSTPTTHTNLLTRAGGTFGVDQICLYYAGQDAAPGNVIGVSLHAAGVPTDVADPVLEQIALPRLQLLGSYPNPFNPTTTLRYRLASAGAVDLVIHDLAGRRVRQLVAQEPHHAGLYERVWDGRDDAGNRVASGVYVARVAANGESATYKVVLLK